VHYYTWKRLDEKFGILTEKDREYRIAICHIKPNACCKTEVVQEFRINIGEDYIFLRGYHRTAGMLY